MGKKNKLKVRPAFDEDTLYLYMENPYGMGHYPTDLRDGYRSAQGNGAFQRISQWIHYLTGPSLQAKSLYCKPNSADIIVPIEVDGREESRIRHLLGYHRWINFVLPESPFLKQFGARWAEQISTIYMCTEQTEDRLVTLEYNEVFLDSKRVYHEFKSPLPPPDLPFEPTPRGGLKASLPTVPRLPRSPTPPPKAIVKEEIKLEDSPPIKKLDPYEQEEADLAFLVKGEDTESPSRQASARPIMAIPDDESDEDDDYPGQRQQDIKPTESELQAAIEAYENLPPPSLEFVREIKPDPADEPQEGFLPSHVDSVVEKVEPTEVEIKREINRIKEDEISSEIERVQGLWMDEDMNREREEERVKQEEIAKEMERVQRIIKAEALEGVISEHKVKADTKTTSSVGAQAKLEKEDLIKDSGTTQNPTERNLKRLAEDTSGASIDQGFKKIKAEPLD
ncbi:hypothetical protein FRC03_003917 [Tulasnella sp. 419]|nr:hypothetical protein FRC03_003917 [Tulasnella sp. 419]